MGKLYTGHPGGRLSIQRFKCPRKLAKKLNKIKTTRTLPQYIFRLSTRTSFYKYRKFFVDYKPFKKEIDD
jgi:hypothetical protein